MHTAPAARDTYRFSEVVCMKITFFGATHEVTGSCTMVEVGGKYLLVDCGMEQGKDTFVNKELSVNPGQVDFVLLRLDQCHHLYNLLM